MFEMFKQFPAYSAFQLLSFAFILFFFFLLLAPLFHLFSLLFFSIQLDSTSIFLTTTASILLSPVQFYWLKTLSCLFLSVSFNLSSFASIFNFCSSPIFFLSSTSSPSFCLYSFPVPFLSPHLLASAISCILLFPSNLSSLSITPSFLLLPSLNFLSISPMTFSPSHLISYPVFLFLSISLVSFSFSPFPYFCPS